MLQFICAGVENIAINQCCAQYTIRCEAFNFTLTRSQKKVMKRMKHFLNTGEKPKKLRHFAVAKDGSGNIKYEHKLAGVTCSCGQKVNTFAIRSLGH